MCSKKVVQLRSSCRVTFSPSCVVSFSPSISCPRLEPVVVAPIKDHMMPKPILCVLVFMLSLRLCAAAATQARRNLPGNVLAITLTQHTHGFVAELVWL